MKTLFVFIKPIAILVVALFLSNSSVAQKKLDVVTLKNGNILKGKIVRQVPGQFLEIETRDKNFWKFDMEDVAEIRFELKQPPKKSDDSIVKQNQTISFEARMGVLAGNSENRHDAPFSLLMSTHYLFKNGLSVGAGTGYEAFGQAQLPVFGELKYHAKINGVHTFAFCQSGYSFSVENKDNYFYNTSDEYDSKGGWLINPGVGFVFGRGSNPNFTLNIGYRFQKIKHKLYNSYTEDTEYLKEEFNRLSIHLGICF